MRNMTATLIVKQLYRGYVLTDFGGHDIGIKDSEQVIEEIRILLKESEKNNGQLMTDNESHSAQYAQQNNDNNSQAEKQTINDDSKLQTVKGNTRLNRVELHRKIFEKAKEQIDLVGKINCAKIARELCVSNSSVHLHIKKMNVELDELIKNRDAPIINNDIIVQDSVKNMTQ